MTSLRRDRYWRFSKRERGAPLVLRGSATICPLRERSAGVTRRTLPSPTSDDMIHFRNNLKNHSERNMNHPMRALAPAVFLTLSLLMSLTARAEDVKLPPTMTFTAY